MRSHFYFFLFLLCTQVLFSQKEETHTIRLNNELLTEVLVEIEKKYDVRFSYKDAILKNKRVTFKKKRTTLRELLFFFEEELGVTFQKVGDNNFVVLKKESHLNKIQQLDDVIITNYLTSGIYKKKNTVFELDLKKLTILPGLVERDIIESIQQLPGVISPNETATGLIVRGGANDQNRIVWDGINNYHKGHLFGMISPFNPTMIDKVTFYNKGTHPRFGERISSVIHMETSKEITENSKGSLDINGINASLFLATPLVKDKLSIQTSFRRSYEELYSSFTLDQLTDKVFQNTKIINAENTSNDFYFLDANLKLNYKLNTKNQLYFSAFTIDNNLDYEVNDLNENQVFNDILEIRNEGYSLQWDTKWNDKIDQNTLVSFSRYDFNYNFITEENGEQVSDFDKRNIIFDTSLQTEVTVKMPEKDKLALGYQYNFKDVSYAFLQTTNLNLILDRDQTKVTTHALFANYTYHHPFLNVTGGLRINHFSELNSTQFEPRFVLYRDLTHKLKLQITGEVKSQIINQIDETVLSDLSLENELWRLSNGEEYPILESSQITAGLLYKSKGWHLDIDLYTKRTNGLTALSLGFLNPVDNSVHVGSQKTNGVDLYVQKSITANVRAWMNYSYSNAKSKFEGINNDRYFMANNTIAHTGSLSLAYKKEQIEVALGFNIHSGKPYTRSIVQEDGSLNFEGINTERLPVYHRLDLSSTYQFDISKKNNLHGKIGLSIRNLYDQNNQISREYLGNNSFNDPVRVIDKFSIGFTPNFLLKVYW